MQISIKAARVNKDMTQKEAADKLGIDKKTLCSWEKQKTMPSADKIALLCSLYEVDYDNIRWTAL
jgi:transcriptional regulator with XRE-family HTH domain